MRSPLIKRTCLAAVVGAFALFASGCVSILSGENVVTQRAPGVATLGATFCISDYDANSYGAGNASNPTPNCTRSGVQETDNGCHPGEAGGICTADGDDQSTPQSVQLLVAFRVPNGVIEPPSFQNDAQSTTFNFSKSYTDGLKVLLPPPAGEHWVGYISGFKDSLDPKNKPSDRTFAVHAEFDLPTANDGGPFPGPLKYRITAGLRQVTDSSQSGDAVTCDGSGPHFTLCADTPTNTPPSFPADLSKPVSDFGVLGGSRSTAGQGGSATVTFPVKYLDGGGLGAKDLKLSASTTLPGGLATPGADTMHVTPGSTNNMNVTVAVPAAAPLGDYRVTLTASNGTPATTRTNTGTITVADQAPPTIRIGTPRDGSTFRFGQAVAADYDCSDQTNASGVQSCSGPVPNGGLIDTGSLGQKLFTVNTSDNAGNTSATTTTYTVNENPAPAISMPFSYARFKPKTALIALQVKGIPKGSTLTVKCKAKKGKRCPVRKRFRKVNPKKNVTLKKFFPKSYPPGTMLEARVTKTGSVTAIRRTVFRKNKRPISVRMCQPIGQKPKKC